MDDDHNSRPRTYWWVIILLILAVLICIFLNPLEEFNEPIITHKENNNINNTNNNPDYISPNLNLKNESQTFYHQLDEDINFAIQQFEKKTREAQRIVPYFPSFPNIWLLPPKDKGIYGSIPERYCIEFLHLLFPEYTFIKQKHKWLRNPKTNYPLELDGYCPELKIAIEYNGIQHYVWPNYFHTTVEQFLAQKERDEFKANICIQQNICLIRIPYTVPLERIPLAIYAKLLESVPGMNF